MSQAVASPAEVTQDTAAPAKFHKYPWWAPRFWHGMTVSAWFGLLARNRFRISPTRLPMVLAVSFFSVFNSCMRLLQGVVHGGRVEATAIQTPPVFIIGHWRSGTTHLHELMVLDERFTYPTTYECFAPNHFLVTAWWVTRLKFLLPAQRPMDNMVTGWDRPQEDEFALLNMGAGSPYETMAFPNHRPVRHEFLDLRRVGPEQLENWKRSLIGFLKAISFRSIRQQQRAAKRSRQRDSNPLPKRIVLKSPPHTSRIKVLRQLLPEARFIHIVRDPQMLLASNVRLWKSLWDIQGCQVPRFGKLVDGTPDVEEYVLTTLQQMYDGFDAQKAEVPPGHFSEVKYEDLVREPLREMQRIYTELDLGGFDDVRPKLESYLAGLKDYQPNRHVLPHETIAKIRDRWAEYIERYGYGA